MRATMLVAGAALALAGCVTSRHPLSDAATTRADVRLLGFWRDSAVKAPDAAGPSALEGGVHLIGRSVEEPETLEVVTVGLGEDSAIEVHRASRRTTRIGGRWYMSHAIDRILGAEGMHPLAWNIERYEVVDGDTLHVHRLSRAAVAADVRAGLVRGTVRESAGATNPGTEGKRKPSSVSSVVLEATTEELRAWVGERSDAIFEKEAGTVLRRVRLR